MDWEKSNARRITLEPARLGLVQRFGSLVIGGYLWREVNVSRFNFKTKSKTTNETTPPTRCKQIPMQTHARHRTGNSSLLSVMACRGPTGLLDLLPDSRGLNFNEGDGTSEFTLAPRDYMASALIHVGGPCRPLAPHRQVHGLQHASPQLRRRQFLSLPTCGKHACTQAACFPNSRAPTFDVHKGLQLTSPMSDFLPAMRFTFKYAVGL